MASTYSLTTSSYDGRYLKVELSQEKIIASNQSKITWTLYSAGSEGTWYTVGPTSLNVNNTEVYYKQRVYWDEAIFPAKAGSTSGTITVNHNSDGSLSIPVSLSTAIYTSTTRNASGTWTLDSIPRQATLTAAPNFNDEENPTITYSNPAGNNVTTLQACISLTGSADDIKYRDISKTGTTYTFNLTTAERNVLRNATTTSASRNVIFYVKTVIGGVTYYSTITKKLSIINASVTANPSFIDTNSTTVALTGDSSKFIKYYSNVQYSINAAAYKGASIVSQSMTHGNTTLNTATGSFNNIESNRFEWTAKDSRTSVINGSSTVSMVNYVKLTCNFKPRIAVDGTATITIDGNLFNGSFGAVQNTLAIQIRYRVAGGSWGSWTGVNGTKSGNTYYATKTITGLDYKTKYGFQVKVNDQLATVTTSEITAIALPVFDWGENSFNFNVPVNFSAGYTQGVSVVDGGELTTDYVIEQGTNGIWTYRKWSSGIYECWGKKTVNVAVNTAWGSLYVSGYLGDSMVNLPITFKEVPMINANLSANGAGGFLIASGSVPATTSSTGGYEIARGTSGAANNYVINYDVRGRWK